MSNYLPSRRCMRKRGYLKDQHGIINRYIQEKTGWDIHLDKTKEFIISNLGEKRGGTVVVLGSGWLLDVPIDHLSEKFNKVYLVDINHPTQIKAKIKKYKNVLLLNEDLTGGGIEQINKLVKKYKKTGQITKLDSIELGHTFFYKNADFVISVNILNQLNIILTDYLNKFKLYEKKDILDFSKRLQYNHISGLPDGRSCLISDWTEKYYDVKDQFIGSRKLVYIDVPKTDNILEWTWEFDRSMTYYNDKKTVFVVKALCL